MKSYVTNIEELTLKNENFRAVLYTALHSQLVVMCLKPNQEIGLEVHTDNDQFFRIEQGVGKCIIDGNEYIIGNGTAIVVPAGAKHNIINTSATEKLKLYTIYSPAHHRDKIIHQTRDIALADNESFDGKTTA